MRKLIYKLYIGSYNNKFHAYVHMRCQTVLKLSKNVNIIKILYALRKKTRGYRYMVLSHNRLKMLAFFHFFHFFLQFSFLPSIRGWGCALEGIIFATLELNNEESVNI